MSICCAVSVNIPAVHQGPSSSLADQLAGWHPEARDRPPEAAWKPIAVYLRRITMNVSYIWMYVCTYVGR